MTAHRRKWVIVGGGIHGVHLAVQLIGGAGVVPDDLLIVDPGPELLHAWNRGAANTGMEFLRSPAVHHLDIDVWSLLRFGGGAGGRRSKPPPGTFAQPYNRPSTELFARHCADVIERYGLAARHRRARVAALKPSCESVAVELDDGAVLHAEHVVLALGAGDRVRWPDWTESVRQTGVLVHHVLQDGYELEPERLPERVAVVGAGITGVQIALRVAEAGRAVQLVARRPVEEHEFDSDPAWHGPRNLRRYSAIADLAERRRWITQARHRGSVPPALHRTLRYARNDGRIAWRPGEVEATEGGLAVDGQPLEVDAVLLATGFDGGRPGGALVDGLIEAAELPCAACGYPVVDRQLRWHPRVFVTGPLAELELGPVARNIAGARRAAERILPVATAAG